MHTCPVGSECELIDFSLRNKRCFFYLTSQLTETQEHAWQGIVSPTSSLRPDTLWKKSLNSHSEGLTINCRTDSLIWGALPFKLHKIRCHYKEAHLETQVKASFMSFIMYSHTLEGSQLQMSLAGCTLPFSTARPSWASSSKPEETSLNRDVNRSPCSAELMCLVDGAVYNKSELCISGAAARGKKNDSSLKEHMDVTARLLHRPSIVNSRRETLTISECSD